jgi:hypothetical protein
LRDLSAACERIDIVVADRWLPSSCKPRVLKIDRHLLDRTGGLALFLAARRVDTVAGDEGDQGWWRGRASPAFAHGAAAQARVASAPVTPPASVAATAAP